MHRIPSLSVAGLLAFASSPAAQAPPLLPEPVVAALAEELSGEAAKRNLEYLARHHRMRGSSGYRAAAEHIGGELRRYGLSDVRIQELPTDGKRFYGTQKGRLAWNAEFAELWELRAGAGETGGTGEPGSGGADAWVPAVRIASWEAMPMTLAQDSENADVTADLVDVGQGTTESDYAGKEVRGRIVLAAAQPGAVAALAVARHGAAGIVSYAQNQRTAWWGDDDNLVRWGHLDSFGGPKTFGFMVSLRQARAFQQRLARGETIRLRAVVRAGQHPGSYDVVTATIPGRDPARRDELIVFSCHLDHPRPGANDNASGCATILEIARALNQLIRDGRIPPPARTLKFVWPPEIEGTLALLTASPGLPERIKAAVHLDMVGGGPATKAIFHVTRGPASLPSFINDVAEAFGAFVNEQSAAFAKRGLAPFPFTAPEGGKEPLLAEFAEFTMGSDHQIYTDASFGIPAIYLNDWPDRYIHTNFDTPANIDPTKLKRAGFIAAASGYFLAALDDRPTPAIAELLGAHAMRRTATMLQRRGALPPDEAAHLTRFHLWRERRLLDSIDRFAELPAHARAEADRRLEALVQLVTPAPAASRPAAAGRAPAPALPVPPESQLVFRRNPDIRGPMSAFGYDYFSDHYGSDRAGNIRLLRYQGARGSGGEYAYEVLNLADGRRTAQEIRDFVSAVYGPVPLDLVVEYLRALAEIGVVIHHEDRKR
jgi:aminopeptidase YwaD